VAASECQAWHPVDCHFDTMVLVTVPRHLLSLFHQTVAADGEVLCLGAALAAFPFTHHPRSPLRHPPTHEPMAEGVRTALLAADPCSRRSTLLPPPCAFTPGSAAAPAGPPVATLARAQAGIWRRRTDGLASLVTAGVSRTETHVLQWRLDDPSNDLAALPPLIDGADLRMVPTADLDTGQTRGGWEVIGPEDGLHRLEESLLPGDVLLVRVAAGGACQLHTLEGTYDLTLALPTWLFVRHPLDARVPAATRGSDGSVHVGVTQAAGAAYLERRPTLSAPLSPTSRGESASPARRPQSAPEAPVQQPTASATVGRAWGGTARSGGDRRCLAP
jgi:hypothetical protein